MKEIDVCVKSIIGDNMNKVILCIMDGIGIRKEDHGNAVRCANTKNLDILLEKYPHSLLEASGELVGLPDGQMGNSEVGHSNIGSGRIIYQPLEMINKSSLNGTFLSLFISSFILLELVFNSKELLLIESISFWCFSISSFVSW